MKKQQLSIVANVLSLVALFILFSSFTYLAHDKATSANLQNTFLAYFNDFSLEKLSFWQKAALCLGASTGGYALIHRRHHRHHSSNIGCLGILGLIIVGALVIALLPLILVVGLVMLILGVPFPNARHRRHRR